MRLVAAASAAAAAAAVPAAVADRNLAKSAAG